MQNDALNTTRSYYSTRGIGNKYTLESHANLWKTSEQPGPVLPCSVEIWGFALKCVCSVLHLPPAPHTIQQVEFYHY